MYQKFMLSSWHNSLLYASEDSISSVSPGEKRCHYIHMGVTILLLLATQGLILIAAAALSFLTFAGLMNAPLLLGFTFLLIRVVHLLLSPLSSRSICTCIVPLILFD